jgi:hypothetical protein
MSERLASLFLNTASKSPSGYQLDASTTNSTHVTLVGLPPESKSVQNALDTLVDAHDMPVQIQIPVFDEAALNYTTWCATYDSQPKVTTQLVASPCLSNEESSQQSQVRRSPSKLPWC